MYNLGALGIFRLPPIHQLPEDVNDALDDIRSFTRLPSRGQVPPSLAFHVGSFDASSRDAFDDRGSLERPQTPRRDWREAMNPREKKHMLTAEQSHSWAQDRVTELQAGLARHNPRTTGANRTFERHRRFSGRVENKQLHHHTIIR